MPVPDRESNAATPSTGREPESDTLSDELSLPDFPNGSSGSVRVNHTHTPAPGGMRARDGHDSSSRTREEKSDGRPTAERLRELMGTSIGTVITFDDTGAVESIDGTAEMLLGYASRELLGHPVVKILTIDNERSAAETDCLVRLRRKDGSTFPARLTLGRDSGRGRYVAIIHPEPTRKEPGAALVTRVSLERKRIGRELHDTIGQELSGVALVSGTLIHAIREHERTCVNLGAKVAEGVQRALDHVRALMTGLTPVEVRGDELTASLDELAERVQSSHAVDCVFEESGSVGVPTDATATHLYLMTQEAVTNALKHSQAKAIAINLSTEGASVVLRITDDGTGFDDPAVRNPNGLGLRIMRERAELIGGDLRIESTPGTGTTVTCILRERFAHDEDNDRGGPPPAGGRSPAGREGDDR